MIQDDPIFVAVIAERYLVLVIALIAPVIVAIVYLCRESRWRRLYQRRRR